MDQVTSNDGTSIAFDRLGDGPPIILVAGAFSYRKYPKSVRIAELLAEQFTVINYDRRGRGDSGDSPPYAVEREIDDLQALTDAAGGWAYIWGLSSGAILALRAAASGVRIRRLAVYQPPFIVDPGAQRPPPEFAGELSAAIKADRRSAAVKLFMTKGMGAPAPIVNLMRLTPVWPRLKAVAHTLPYDFAIVGDNARGKPLCAADWAAVTMPTLVMDGQRSPRRARQAAEMLTEILPNAHHIRLKGQGIDVAPQVVVPELIAFFQASDDRDDNQPHSA